MYIYKKNNIDIITYIIYKYSIYVNNLTDKYPTVYEAGCCQTQTNMLVFAFMKL